MFPGESRPGSNPTVGTAGHFDLDISFYQSLATGWNLSVLTEGKQSELDGRENNNQTTDLSTVEIVASSSGTAASGYGGILRQLGNLELEGTTEERIKLGLLGRRLTRAYHQGGFGNWSWHFVEKKIKSAK